MSTPIVVGERVKGLDRVKCPVLRTFIPTQGTPSSDVVTKFVYCAEEEVGRLVRGHETALGPRVEGTVDRVPTTRTVTRRDLPVTILLPQREGSR